MEKKEKENVIFFTQLPPPYAGPEIMTQGFIDYFRKINFDILIIKSNIQKNNFKKGQINIQGIFKFIKLYIKLILKLFDKKNSKIYLTIACGKVGFFRDFIVIMTASLFGKQIYMHLHGGNFDNFYQNSSKLIKKLIRASWGRAKCALALSDTLKNNQLINAAPNVKITVVRNGINTENFNVIEDRKFIKLECTICFLGTLSFTKGFYDLMNVYKKLLNDGIKLKFNVAGEFPEMKPQLSDFLDGSFKEFYLNNHIKITKEIQKFVNEIELYNGKYWGVINNKLKSDFFNNSDIFVLPSYMEGVSVSMLEAMAHGLPIITTNVGGHKDVIINGENGYIIEKGDEKLLKEKLLFLSNNLEKCKEISINNIKKIKEDYEIEKSSQTLYNILITKTKKFD